MPDRTGSAFGDGGRKALPRLHMASPAPAGEAFFDPIN